MLFNSYEFIFAFLPIVVGGFFSLARVRDVNTAIGWLVLASLFYYGWWNPQYLALISISILLNFFVGRLISRNAGTAFGKTSLILGIGLNLSALGYYKYANFFLDNINAVLSTQYSVGAVLLPLGISFFTFQQITYLVDSSKGRAHEYSLLHYALFVSFFPQLIAGPIVHHGEMMPQFERAETFRPQADNIAVGLTIFFIGLTKKTVLADGVAFSRMRTPEGRSTSLLPGAVRWPTRSSSISIFRVIATWRSALPDCSASFYR